MLCAQGFTKSLALGRWSCGGGAPIAAGNRSSLEGSFLPRGVRDGEVMRGVRLPEWGQRILRWGVNAVDGVSGETKILEMVRLLSTYEPVAI